MPVGEYVMPVVDGIWIRFLDSEQMDELPTGVLRHWLTHLNRTQREYAAAINTRARNILNRHQEFNRWLTEEVKEKIMEQNYALQYCSENMIKETCCRFCSATYIGPLNMTRIQMLGLMRELEVHYEQEHPEGWRLMQRNLHSNMLPYL